MNFHEESLISFFEDFEEYSPETWIDTYFAVQNYLYNGQAELDETMSEVYLGITNPKEILKFTRYETLDFIT